MVAPASGAGWHRGGPTSGYRPAVVAPAQWRSRAGAKVLRGLTGVLLAFSIAILVRPFVLLTTALSEGTGLVPAGLAVGLHLVVLALAASLFRRARQDPTGRAVAR